MVAVAFSHPRSGRRATNDDRIGSGLISNSAVWGTSPSVIPSAKYSCSESPDRLPSGSTASAWIFGATGGPPAQMFSSGTNRGSEFFPSRIS
jgi:hypothetical protein